MDEAMKAAQELFNAIAEAGRLGRDAFDCFEDMVSTDNADFLEGMEQLSEFM